MTRASMIALTSGLTIAFMCWLTIFGPSSAALFAVEEPAPRPESVHAVVVDHDGRPAAGVRVMAFGLRAGERELTTDARGRVEVPLTETDRDDSLSLLAIPDEKTLGWSRPTGSRPVDGPLGTADDPLRLTLLPLNREVEGLAVDTDGQPVVGVHVRVVSLNQPLNGGVRLAGVGALGVVRPIEAVTDANGRYRLTVPEGSGATVMARDRGHVSPWVSFKDDADTIKPVTVYPAGTIVGRVTDRATGRPVAGAVVGAQLLDHQSINLGGGWGDARTDDRGRFEIVGLAPGVYNVLPMLEPGGRRFTARAIEGVRVRAGQEATADLERIEARRLAGSVVDAETRTPQARVMIGYYGSARQRSGAAVMSTLTDSGGKFSLDVPPGPAYVYVMDFNRGGRLDREVLEVPERGDPPPVRLVIPRPVPSPGEPKPAPAGGPVMYKKKVEPKAAPKAAVVAKEAVKVEVKTVPAPVAVAPRKKEAGRALTGLVSDPKGVPIPGVRVLFNRGELALANTDRQGIFELEGLPAGALKLDVDKDGFEHRVIDVAAVDEAITIELTRSPGPPRAEPPAPGEVPETLTFADLQPLGNDPLSRGPGDGGNDLDRLPRGVQKLAGRWFRVEDRMIHLRSRNERDFPKSVAGIAVGSKVKEFHALQAVQQPEKPGTVVGRYVLRFDDGTTADLPIAYGVDLANWWSFNPNDARPTLGEIAWTGSNAAIDRNPGLSARLFAATYRNPHPEKVVRAIDFVSEVTDAAPFLVALTLERD